MIWLYRFALFLLSPVLDIWFFIRLLKGKEDRHRINERMGQPQHPRPEGKLVWIHGASVGETLSILPLIEALLAADKTLHVLVTSGTRTSAGLMRERLPARAIHQFVPLDYWPAVYMFFNHWRPDVSVFVESEFWPELLWQAPNPMLVNARVSGRAFTRYMRWGWFWHPFLARFNRCLAQSDADADRLAALGGRNIAVAGNLKYDRPAPPADEAVLKHLQTLIGKRPVLFGAQTHNPEEAVITTVHAALTQAGVKNLLTIIAPRHPQRGIAIAAELEAQGFTVALRSQGAQPTSTTQIYIADTMGEMGLWCRLATVAVMGGSFIPHGGQNPLEPLMCGTPTICGPHMHNFTDMTHYLTHANAMHLVMDVADLITALTPLFLKKPALAAARKPIAGALKKQQGATLRTADAIRRQLQRVS